MQLSGVIDQIHWRGDLSFKQRPFNPVDNVAFSLLSYLKFDDIVSCDFKKPYITLEAALKMLKKKVENNPAFFDDPIAFKLYQHDFVIALANAARYKNIRLAGFVNKTDKDQQMQFAAITIFPKGAYPYIAFRGTDSSLIGWKEDFNMAFSTPIPAQIEACKYLCYAAKNFMGKFSIGGHSKGGNLAVYSAAVTSKSMQKRIAAVFSNDGPGFQKDFITCKGYKNIKDKIEGFIPKDSIIGLLFEHDYKLSIVASSAQGFTQHNPYTWNTCRDDFVRVPAITEKAAGLNASIAEWINGMDNEQREKFVEALYEIISATDIKSIPQFVERWFQNTTIIIRSFMSADKETKKTIIQTISDFIGNVRKNTTAHPSQKTEGDN